MKNSRTEQQVLPVIIIGAGRSGTKFLRDVLKGSPEVSAVPFDVGYVWKIGKENIPHDELESSTAPEQANLIRSLLHRLAAPKLSAGTKYLIEKTVSNSLRVEFVHQIFPEAKFIHLVRDGRAVTESAIRMWQQPPKAGYLWKKLRYFPWRSYRHAIWYAANLVKGKFTAGRGQLVWGPRYDGIEEDARTQPLEVTCARQWKKCVTATRRGLSAIPQNNVLEVRYEELVGSDKTIADICDFIGLETSEPVVDLFRKKLQPQNDDKWRTGLTGQQLELVLTEIGSTLTEMGYD